MFTTPSLYTKFIPVIALPFSFTFPLNSSVVFSTLTLSVSLSISAVCMLNVLNLYWTAHRPHNATIAAAIHMVIPAIKRFRTFFR